MEKIKLTKEEEEIKNQILRTTFKELTLPCKIGIIGCWIYLTFFAILFLYGFYLGVMGGI